MFHSKQASVRQVKCRVKAIDATFDKIAIRIEGLAPASETFYQILVIMTISTNVNDEVELEGILNYPNIKQAICNGSFILMPSKTRTCYDEAFQKIKEIVEEDTQTCYPRSLILIDFERNIRNSCEKNFDCVVSGCFFHYSQALWTNFVKKGLTVYYNKKSGLNLRLEFAMLQMLAFLPMI